MTKIIGVGDNVLDHYLDQHTLYPGGNAVNVPVLMRRFGGADAAYIGAVGADREGRWLLRALEREGVDISRVQVLSDRPTSRSRIRLVDGDRTFVPGGEPGASDYLKLTADDYAFLHDFDLVHTSIYSQLDSELPRLREHSRCLAYDFSSEATVDHLAAVFPFVDFAFISGSDLSEDELAARFRLAAAHDVPYCLITLGARGSRLAAGGNIYTQGIHPATEVVDTLGAGDAFIAAFLYGILNDKGIPAALEDGAAHAAKICGHHGAFAYPLAAD